MQRNAPPVQAAIGYASGPNGAGLAYAELRLGARRALVRVPFNTRAAAGLGGLDVGFEALRATSRTLLERGIAGVEFLVDDPALVEAMNRRDAQPAALVPGYIALRCRLNRFAHAAVRYDEAATRDVGARARAEALFERAA